MSGNERPLILLGGDRLKSILVHLGFAANTGTAGK
jgi:hypothetical protein